MRTAYMNGEGNLVLTSYIEIPAELKDGEVELTSEPTDDVSLFFLNAWELDGSNIVINQTKAAAIKLEQLRAMRTELFVGVDARRAVASDTNDTEELADVRRQATALRNVPAVAEVVFESAASPADIYNYVPDIFAELLG